MNELLNEIEAIKKFKAALEQLISQPFWAKLTQSQQVDNVLIVRNILNDLEKFATLHLEVERMKQPWKKTDVADIKERLHAWKLQLYKAESLLFEMVDHEYDKREHLIYEAETVRPLDDDLDQIENWIEDYLLQRDTIEKLAISQLEYELGEKRDKSAQRVIEDGELPLLEIRRAFRHNRRSPVIFPMQPEALEHSFIPIKSLRPKVNFDTAVRERLFPDNRADFSSTNQGYTGDCYILAALDATLNVANGAHYLAGVMRDLSDVAHITGNPAYKNKILIRFSLTPARNQDHDASSDPAYLLLDKAVLANELCAVNSKLWVTIFEQAFNCIERDAEWLQQAGGNFVEVSTVFFQRCDGSTKLFNPDRDLFYNEFWKPGFEKSKENIEFLKRHGFSDASIGFLTRLKKILPDGWQWPVAPKGGEITYQEVFDLFMMLVRQKSSVLSEKRAILDTEVSFNRQAELYAEVIDLIHNMIQRYCPDQDQTKLTTDQQETFSVFQKALKNNRPICVGTYVNLGETRTFGHSFGEGILEGFAANHAYAVLGLEREISVNLRSVKPKLLATLKDYYVKSNVGSAQQFDDFMRKDPAVIERWVFDMTLGDKLLAELKNALIENNNLVVEHFIIIKNPWGQYGVASESMGVRVKERSTHVDGSVHYTMDASNQAISRIPWRVFLTKMQHYIIGNVITETSASSLSAKALNAFFKARKKSGSGFCEHSVLIYGGKPIDIMKISVSATSPREQLAMFAAKISIGFIREHFSSQALLDKIRELFALNSSDETKSIALTRLLFDYGIKSNKIQSAIENKETLSKDFVMNEVRKSFNPALMERVILDLLVNSQLTDAAKVENIAIYLARNRQFFDQSVVPLLNELDEIKEKLITYTQTQDQRNLKK